jgi:outer membrane protein OmpA-like peptidoglycan-associated protein
MKKWTLITASLLLWGCSSAPKVESFPDSADALEEINKLNQEMNDARNNTQVEIGAPKAWKEASDYEKKAQERLASKSDKDRILSAIADSRAWMKKALAETDHLQLITPDLLEVRKQALDVRAQDFAKNEFGKAENAFRSFTRDAEGSDRVIADDDRAQIRNLYIDARVAGLQNVHLGKARSAMNEANELGAQKLVPNVYLNAERSLKNAEGFISANRMDIPGIEEQCKKATFDAQRLNHLTKLARNIRGSSPEQAAIALDKSRQTANAMAGKVEKIQGQMAESMNEAAFQERLEQARQMFSHSEAEVYRQGNTLLIRLKSIEFPTARTALPETSYSLITKVGNVIKSFGEPQVRVEGHTDSVGGEPINLQISLARAEAVKAYLVANTGLRPEQIEVAGLGFARPIASNKTAIGRAQNRRVDVIVTPQMEQNSSQIRQAQ